MTAWPKRSSSSKSSAFTHGSVSRAGTLSISQYFRLTCTKYVARALGFTHGHAPVVRKCARMCRSQFARPWKPSCASQAPLATLVTTATHVVSVDILTYVLTWQGSNYREGAVSVCAMQRRYSSRPAARVMQTPMPHHRGSPSPFSAPVVFFFSVNQMLIMPTTSAWSERCNDGALLSSNLKWVEGDAQWNDTLGKPTWPAVAVPPATPSDWS